ncbi:MAG: hypothetical protein ACOYL3_09195 [Desulfuromonadaceae bacterium]
MKKNINKNVAGNSDVPFNPELLFCNDATVVDFLNALLESEPALNMDFREIHFVHQEILPSSKANIVVGNAIFIESEGSKTEAEVLRSANENLKFKTELAEIDVQVLRTENNKLKIDKERLIAQLIELKTKLDTMCAENASMRKAAETDCHLLNEPVINTDNETENIQADAPPCTVKAADDDIDSESGQTALDDIAEKDIQAEPVTVVEENFKGDKNNILTDQESLNILAVTVQNDIEKKLGSSKVAIFSRVDSTGGISRQNVPSVSKIIKHHPVEKIHTRLVGHLVKAASPGEVPPDEKNSIALGGINFVQQQAATLENNQVADSPVSIPVAEPLKDADEINMPSEPAPKAVIRRNVKSYEDLQKESGSNKTAEVSHNLIL